MIGEDQILFPAHHRPVGAPKGHIGGPVRQQEGHGSELGAVVLVGDGLIGAQAQIPKAGPLQHGIHQKRGTGRVGIGGAGLDLGPVVELVEAIPHLGQGHGRNIVGDDPAEVGVHQLGQDQIVHVVEGRGGKGHVSAPVEIVEDIRHSFPLGIKN